MEKVGDLCRTSPGLFFSTRRLEKNSPGLFVAISPTVSAVPFAGSFFMLSGGLRPGRFLHFVDNRAAVLPIPIIYISFAGCKEVMRNKVMRL